MRKKGKGPLQVNIDTDDFEKAMAEFPGLIDGRVAELVAEVKDKAFASVVAKTPVGGGAGDDHPGRARASWQLIKVNDYSYLIVSFLNYMRRLEVGWGAAKQKPGMKLPLGGYRMVRGTVAAMPKTIRAIAAKLAGKNLREQSADFKKAA